VAWRVVQDGLLALQVALALLLPFPWQRSSSPRDSNAWFPAAT